jgi:hypothetical protein
MVDKTAADKAAPSKVVVAKVAETKVNIQIPPEEVVPEKVEYICVFPCQVRLDKRRIRFFAVGDIWSFNPRNEVPDTFEPLSQVVIDFDESSEQELRHGNFDAGELRGYMLRKYKKNVPFIEKSELIDALLDARFRDVTSR